MDIEYKTKRILISVVNSVLKETGCLERNDRYRFLNDFRKLMYGHNPGKSLDNSNSQKGIEQVLTRSEVAKILRISQGKVTSYVRAGLIKPIGLPDARGSYRRFSKSSVVEFINRDHFANN